MNYTLTSTPHPQDGPRIDYQSLLNAEQYAAVSAPPGPLLVIAGAGSGKTRTLTYRVAFLVEHGVAPEHILLLTFTNKAAKEMLRRVENLLPHDISRLWGGTFHHVGHRLIRRHAELLGLNRNFNILDREDAKDLVAACLAESTVDPKDKQFPKAEVLQDIYSFGANTERSVSEVLESHYPHLSEFAPQIGAIGSAYVKRKQRSGGVDYDDLLTLTVQLLKSHPDLLEFYQHQFQHILVDEYQDTNKIQADLVDLLAARQHQVMVVGDDAQSIYSWRGANFENIMSFPDRHPGTQIIRIETNYRSTPEILNLANVTISQNIRQFPKELRAVNKSGAKPALISLDDARQQAVFVAQRALELREEGTGLGDIAVLYRSHFHSMELQMELTRRNIPFQITSGLRFFEQAHVKDAAAYLKYALNANDEVSFKRLATMLPGVGGKTAHKAWEAVARGVPWDQVKVPAKAVKEWRQWGETHRQLLEKIKTDTPGRQLQHVLDAVYEDFLKVRYPNYNNRLEDLHQLIQFADGFKETSEFLAQLSLMTNMETEQGLGAPDAGHEALKLSSIHQAKGLEWKAVFVIMLCDGLFPSNRAVETTAGEEEERRLFYVAVTRAQEELYLLYPQIRSNANYGETWQKPSRFLSDFPRDLCNVWTIKTEKPWGEY
ncbi:MAG: UvrD-helicase domain-containing protein [Verrucomicrobiales bacterium]|jgi:DNA helicase-2/ATP-dependent DNA helicase PcrA|nr:UvrD-helicase domain-containing protein [Verrucomicrobiales bacterium]